MKKIIAVALSFVIFFSLCSCGEKNDTDHLQNRIGELEQGANSQEEKNNNKVKTVSLNTPFNVGDVMTITLNNSRWCEEIYPSNTKGTYSYYDDTKGEKYFVVSGELKNLASDTFDIKYSSEAQIKINDKYNLPVTFNLEEVDGTSFYGEAKPLQTLKLIAYASVSDELYEECKTIELTFNIVNDETKLNYFYDESYPQDCFSISFNK